MTSVQRNISIYPWFRMAADGYAWIPVFFLYMNTTLSIEKVIQLSAIYYLSVFLLEVPSGYFSDRFGRRQTLMLSALSLIAAYVCFIVGLGFWWFAMGQFLLASGIAMQSGTDTALHYDSLQQLGRESEYQQREAKAEQWGLTSLAIACLAGGLLGSLDLRLAYVYAFISAIVMAILVWRFKEPTHKQNSSLTSQSFAQVLVVCFGKLRKPKLLWLFVFSVVMYAIAHIVFELYQPYLTLVHLPDMVSQLDTPQLSGLVIAISMFGGALGARISTSWQTKLGLAGILAVGMVIQLSIVAAMAYSVSLLVVIMICWRNFPMAFVHAPIRAAIAPHISSSHRATYLSLQGLADRLFFALMLLTLAAGMNSGSAVKHETLQTILLSCLVVGLLLSVLLWVFKRGLRDSG
ncbi:MAG: MFS family permease [Parasphingorhabdus sp.]|jgi:MFS family permease